MIRIRFTDLDAKKRALGRLAGRLPFKSWATGEMLVPEAQGFLATENISFQVEGPATYEQITPGATRSCCRSGSMTASPCPMISSPILCSNWSSGSGRCRPRRRRIRELLPT